MALMSPPAPSSITFHRPTSSSNSVILPPVPFSSVAPRSPVSTTRMPGMRVGFAYDGRPSSSLAGPASSLGLILPNGPACSFGQVALMAGLVACCDELAACAPSSAWATTPGGFARFFGKADSLAFGGGGAFNSADDLIFCFVTRSHIRCSGSADFTFSL